MLTLRDEKFSRKLVCFPLLLSLGFFVGLNKYISLAVKQNMPSLVEKRKPEVIIGVITETQLHDGVRL